MSDWPYALTFGAFFVLALAKPVWDRMSQAQQKLLREAAGKQAEWGDHARLEDEAGIAKSLEGRGLVIEKVDLAAFRANADKLYAEPAEWQVQGIGDFKQVHSQHPSC